MVSFFFHAKGSEELNWRHASEKKSKEMDISLRQNRALKADTQGRDATGVVHSLCVLLLSDDTSTVVREGALLCQGAAWAV
jgi:hypothetical protein